MKNATIEYKNPETKPKGHLRGKSVSIDFENLFPEESRPPIQWPSEQQLSEVSQKLLRIKKLGMKFEGGGDHFNSGDLAYQLHEVMRLTQELMQKALRVNH